MGTFVSGIAVKNEHIFQLYEVEEAEIKASEISEKRSCPVLSAYIYDGDFWGYTLYINGKVKDEFSTIPDYFEEGEAVIQHYTADVSLLSQSFAVAADRIEKYLCHWTDELLDGENTAYEDDDFPYGDAWQLVDFLRALGFQYPEEVQTSQIDNQMPTLREILEQNISPLAEGTRLEEYTLITKLPSAFSYDYIRDLLKEDGVREFAFEDMHPANIIETIRAYCLSVSRPECDKLCQRLSVLAAFCSFWMSPGNGWDFLDCATYEPICLNYEKPTDIYVLRARAAITDFIKRHRAFRDLKRLLELDAANAELYESEIKKWQDREQEWIKEKNYGKFL